MKHYIIFVANKNSIELSYNTENEINADMPFVDDMTEDMLQGITVVKESDPYISDGVYYIVKGDIARFLYFLTDVMPFGCRLVYDNERIL